LFPTNRLRLLKRGKYSGASGCGVDLKQVYSAAGIPIIQA
jgi:hypothetical protein